MAEDNDGKFIRGSGLDKKLTKEIPEDIGYAPGSMILDPRTGEIRPNPLYKANTYTNSKESPAGAEGDERTEESLAERNSRNIETSFRMLGITRQDFIDKFAELSETFIQQTRAEQIRRTGDVPQDRNKFSDWLFFSSILAFMETDTDLSQTIQDKYPDDYARVIEAKKSFRESRRKR